MTLLLHFLITEAEGKRGGGGRWELAEVYTKRKEIGEERSSEAINKGKKSGLKEEKEVVAVVEGKEMGEYRSGERGGNRGKRRG